MVGDGDGDVPLSPASPAKPLLGQPSSKNNVANIGICLLGDFDHERPDPRALESLERLTDALCERHHIAHNRVYGHQKFAPTECPGDALMAWIARYSAGATH